HPAIRAAAVVARRHAGGYQLVAFYVRGDAAGHGGADDAPALAAVLRGHLAGALPDDMIPALFLPIDALPMTHNGKLNRK
ncbi:hypothetical protein AAHH78_39425, partial [Burkholderia pseudomallei]